MSERRLYAPVYDVERDLILPPVGQGWDSRLARGLAI